MKKIILKKTHYNRIPEVVFGLIVCIIFVSLLIFDILSGENKISSNTYVGGILIFGGMLVFYSWRLFTQKPLVHYVNINGWTYRSFQRMSKWKFICINGFLSSMRYGVIIAMEFLLHLIKNDLSPLEVILIIIGLCIISAIPYGLINYKKYAAVDMNSYLQHPL